ncbi:hypothetical protein D3C85_1407500 [compost metagenome]
MIRLELVRWHGADQVALHPQQFPVKKYIAFPKRLEGAAQATLLDPVTELLNCAHVVSLVGRALSVFRAMKTYQQPFLGTAFAWNGRARLCNAWGVGSRPCGEIRMAFEGALWCCFDGYRSALPLLWQRASQRFVSNYVRGCRWYLLQDAKP